MLHVPFLVLIEWNVLAYIKLFKEQSFSPPPRKTFRACISQPTTRLRLNDTKMPESRLNLLASFLSERLET